jgi:hypothetical protein
MMPNLVPWKITQFIVIQDMCFIRNRCSQKKPTIFIDPSYYALKLQIQKIMKLIVARVNILFLIAIVKLSLKSK